MIQPVYSRDGITIYCGDNREVMPQLDVRVSAVVTDPPYGLSKEPDIAEVLTHWLAGDDYRASGGGFMGKTWDSFVPGPATWRVIAEAMLPGAHLLAFSGTRTYDLMGIAIRLAGLHYRDTLQWLYGSGFPKSLDVSKAIDKLNGRKFEDRYALGRHIRERREALGLSRADVNTWFGYRDGCEHWERQDSSGARVPTLADWRILQDRLGLADDWLPLVERAEAEREVVASHDNGYKAHYGGEEAKTRTVDITAPATPEAERWAGWGTALKPAYEPVILARKPLSGTVASTVLAHGTGALNIDGTRVRHQSEADCAESERKNQHSGYKNPNSNRDSYSGEFGPRTDYDGSAGRWPPNVLMDETAAAALDQMSGERPGMRSQRDLRHTPSAYFGADKHPGTREGYNDTGGASRFFPVLPIDEPDTLRFRYQAKAPARERWGVLTCDCTKEQAWANEDQSHNDQTATTSPQPDTSEVTSTAASDSRTPSSGSNITGQSQTATSSTTSTATSRTTESKTCSSSTPPHTSDCIRDANSGMANGTSPADSAEKPNASTPITGISAPKAGRSTASAAPVTSLKSARTSECDVCGKPRSITSHPTQKPESLMRWLLTLVTPPGGVVLDPFAGSGSTLVAAAQLGIPAIGVEMDPEYCEIAARRIDHALDERAAGKRWGNGTDASRAGGNVTFDRAAGDRSREQYRTGTVVGTARPADKGRWPSNVLMDRAAAAVLDTQSGERESRPGKNKGRGMGYHGAEGDRGFAGYPGDTGGASRFMVVLDDGDAPDGPDALRQLELMAGDD